jgi:hypothetical protein
LKSRDDGVGDPEVPVVEQGLVDATACVNSVGLQIATEIAFCEDQAVLNLDEVLDQ